MEHLTALAAGFLEIEDSEYAVMQKMTPAQQHELVALMEQSLLADRFRLKVHFDTREMPVYALVVAAGQGSRFGAPLPKQYLPLGGVNILRHAVAALRGPRRIRELAVPRPQ